VEILMGRVPSFRSLVSLLLAAWMPFCCCNLHALASACRACGPADHSGSSVANGHHGSGESTTGHRCGGHHGDDSAPSEPANPGHHDNGPCTCGKDKLATIGAQPVGIDFPTPVLICVLPDWDSAWAPHGNTPGHGRASFAPRLPTTSLLHLHCALII
jgi:hypothetical protein